MAIYEKNLSWLLWSQKRDNESNPESDQLNPHLQELLSKIRFNVILGETSSLFLFLCLLTN
jgi:hypothetical protein